MSDPREGVEAQGTDAGDSRPRPAYGEYAPEGWSWTPPGAEQAEGGNGGSASASGGKARGTAGAAQSRPSDVPAGVPHNLGARGTTSGAPSRPQPATGQESAPGSAAGRQDPPPYRADDPRDQRREARPAAAPAPAPAGGANARPRPRTADRVITIMLLVVGAFGALNMAATMFALDAQMQLMGSMLGIDDLQVPGWVATVGLITGLAILLVYALNVIYAIQRMRAGKIAFWVPLTAFAIAFVFLIVAQMIAMYNSPEIIEQLNSDPYGSYGKMMQFLEDSSAQ